MSHVTTVAAGNANLAALSENVIYLMGISFVLGSLFTVFVLLLLEFMRRNNKPM